MSLNNIRDLFVLSNKVSLCYNYIYGQQIRPIYRIKLRVYVCSYGTFSLASTWCQNKAPFGTLSLYHKWHLLNCAA